jgi:hypothetical protein
MRILCVTKFFVDQYLRKFIIAIMYLLAVLYRVLDLLGFIPE